MIYKMDTVLQFGRYQEFTVEEVIQLNPQYVDWMIREFEDCEFDDEVLDAVEKKLRY